MVLIMLPTFKTLRVITPVLKNAISVCRQLNSFRYRALVVVLNCISHALSLTAVFPRSSPRSQSPAVSRVRRSGHLFPDGGSVGRHDVSQRVADVALGSTFFYGYPGGVHAGCPPQPGSHRRLQRQFTANAPPKHFDLQCRPGTAGTSCGQGRLTSFLVIATVSSAPLLTLIVQHFFGGGGFENLTQAHFSHLH